jgi:hypothetical protein
MTIGSSVLVGLNGHLRPGGRRAQLLTMSGAKNTASPA